MNTPDAANTDRAAITRATAELLAAVNASDADRCSAVWAADGVLGEITVVLAGATPSADLDTLVAEVVELVEGGARVKDACAHVVAAHQGAPSRRELYDAVLRSRDSD